MNNVLGYSLISFIDWSKVECLWWQCLRLGNWGLGNHGCKSFLLIWCGIISSWFFGWVVAWRIWLCGWGGCSWLLRRFTRLLIVCVYLFKHLVHLNKACTLSSLVEVSSKLWYCRHLGCGFVDGLCLLDWSSEDLGLVRASLRSCLSSLRFARENNPAFLLDIVVSIGRGCCRLILSTWSWVISRICLVLGWLCSCLNSRCFTVRHQLSVDVSFLGKAKFITNFLECLESFCAVKAKILLQLLHADRAWQLYSSSPLLISAVDTVHEALIVDAVA